MVIREINVSDAAKFQYLTSEVEGNSEYMLWELDERKIDIDKQIEKINEISTSKNSTIMVAEYNNKLCGYILALGGSARRNKHSAYLVVGVTKKERGKGIGSRLFEALEIWAKENKIHRLELTVVTENKHGVALYKKQGFVIEGVKKDSLLINGKFVDEYYMAKII